MPLEINKMKIKKNETGNNRLLPTSNFQLPTFLTAGFFFLSSSPDLLACSVCFGNPNSAQSKGVVAGVILLLLVTVGVLSAAAYTFVRWGMRERELEKKRLSSPVASRL